MNLREQTAVLQGLLEQQLSIEEGLLTSNDLPPYIDALCHHVASAGYEVPEYFELASFIEGVEALLATDNSLDESLLRKGISALKGAVARGLAKLPKGAHAKLQKYHAKKATAALDSGDDRKYIHHYTAKHFHQQHGNPEAAKIDAKKAVAHSEPKPGTTHAARRNLRYSKRATATAKAQSKEPYAAISARKAAARSVDFAPQDEPMGDSGLSSTIKSPKSGTATIKATTVTKLARPKRS
jgi:hypothetical protein